jgi:hypothetical protein
MPSTASVPLSAEQPYVYPESIDLVLTSCTCCVAQVFCVDAFCYYVCEVMKTLQSNFERVLFIIAEWHINEQVPTTQWQSQPRWEPVTCMHA